MQRRGGGVGGEKGVPREPEDWSRQCLSSDSMGLGGWLRALVERNSAAVDAAGPEQGFFSLSEEAAAFIFTACVELALPRRARRLALLLFDRFMSKELKAVRLRLREPRDGSVQAALAELGKKMDLRALTAVQLASKTVSVHHSLEPRALLGYLRQHCGGGGVEWSMEDMRRSEQEMLEKLGFQTERETEVEMLEGLLGVAVATEFLSPAEAKLYYAFGAELLDMLCLSRSSLYRRVLEEEGVSGSGAEAELRRARLGGDALLATASVVVATGFAKGGRVRAERLAHLYRHLVPARDSTNLGLILYQTASHHLQTTAKRHSSHEPKLYFQA